MAEKQEAEIGTHDLLGSPDHIRVDRALAEFRSGRPVVITSDPDALIVLPAETIDAPRWTAFAKLCAPAQPALVVTRRRAHALGLAAAEPVAIKLDRTVSAERIWSLAADATVDRKEMIELSDATISRPAIEASIELAKLAQVLPAVVVAPAPANQASSATPIAGVEAAAIGQFRRTLAATLKLTTQTDIPLHGGIAARFVLFADGLGRSQTAVVVGRPDFSKPVPVRLHSACLTGDVFGSRRCDCGDQLRLSLHLLRDAGGGIVLYLAQEGRGLGLANKLRAYRLQDTGLDTVDANTTLGFEHDERDYSIAARMLEMLGCSRVRLLSNNPAKIKGLEAAGIKITEHVPLVTPVTSENRRYLATKAARAGHKLGALAEDLAGDVSP